MRVPCRAGDSSVTVAPGTARPSGSTTLPEMIPVGFVWADRGSAASSTSASSAKNFSFISRHSFRAERREFRPRLEQALYRAAQPA